MTTGLRTSPKRLPRPAAPWGCGTSAPGPTRSEPTGRPRGLSRHSARNGPMPWFSRTLRSATDGYPVICRSITGSGSTRPSAGAHPSSDSLSCSADQPGETQQLEARDILVAVTLIPPLPAGKDQRCGRASIQKRTKRTRRNLNVRKLSQP